MQRKEFLTEKMTGFFNARVWKENTPIENRKIKGEDEVIEFNVVYSSAPERFANFAKQYTNKNGEERWRVTFKIGPRAMWFDIAAQPIDKPSNAELDGKRYDIRIQGVELVPDDVSGKTARGYWANAIQIAEHVTNPFTAFMQADVYDPAESDNSGLDVNSETGGDLPF